jgi:membrane fusion protein, multidrug efflux system
MKKKIITIAVTLIIAGSIGIVLANNKAKIDKAANPVKDNAVIPVKVQEVKEDSFTTLFSINGTTAPSKEVKLASEVQGKLVSLYIKNGDIVKAGQVIAVLDASVFNAQLNSIETALAKANLDIDRYSRLVNMGGATAMQVESAVLQQRSLLAQKKEVLQQIAHMQIRAPFSGRIENVMVEKGSFVSYGTILADLLDNSSLKINIYLSEQQAFELRRGQLVSIQTAVFGSPKEGRISMISDKADASGKFLAEISFNNTGREKLRAGMLADVSLNEGNMARGLSIPLSAINGSVKEAKVFVVNNNKVELRSIKTGLITSDKAEVLEGLQAGERIVVSGQINLENGSVVSINQ